MKSIGLKTSRKIPLFNGKLECRFVKYELYEGTRKHTKETIEA
jgi:putative N6-adenine-specific DNA methylase